MQMRDRRHRSATPFRALSSRHYGAHYSTQWALCASSAAQHGRRASRTRCALRRLKCSRHRRSPSTSAALRNRCVIRRARSIGRSRRASRATSSSSALLCRPPPHSLSLVPEAGFCPLRSPPRFPERRHALHITSSTAPRHRFAAATNGSRRAASVSIAIWLTCGFLVSLRIATRFATRARVLLPRPLVAVHARREGGVRWRCLSPRRPTARAARHRAESLASGSTSAARRRISRCDASQRVSAPLTRPCSLNSSQSLLAATTAADGPHSLAGARSKRPVSHARCFVSRRVSLRWGTMLRREVTSATLAAPGRRRTRKRVRRRRATRTRRTALQSSAMSRNSSFGLLTPRGQGTSLISAGRRELFATSRARSRPRIHSFSRNGGPTAWSVRSGRYRRGRHPSLLGTFLAS